MPKTLFNYIKLAVFTRIHVDSREGNLRDSSDSKLIFRNCYQNCWYETLCGIYYCYFSFQPVLHDWCNKGRGMSYPVCGMVHIKEPLLLIRKSSPCGGIGFPLSLSEWFLPYVRRHITVNKMC